MPGSNVPLVPHLVAISCSKPCQVLLRTTLLLGAARYLVGQVTVTSEPDRVLARKVSAVAVRPISAMPLTVLRPPAPAVFRQPLPSAVQRIVVPSVRCP